jgi:DNA-binding MarR family transcriptional regulator
MNRATQRNAEQPDPFEDMLGYHLRRLSVVAMSDLTQSLAPLKLTPAHASILFVIAAQAGITQSDVGKMLGILRANMAPLIALLIERGLIKREAVDGRSHAMRLTALGQTVCRQARGIAKDHEHRVFGDLSRAARARMIDQIRPLWQRKGKEERPPTRR